MSYQKCPLCLGYSESPDKLTECSVCRGAKIIHTVTGKPPIDWSKLQSKRIEIARPGKPVGFGKKETE